LRQRSDDTPPSPSSVFTPPDAIKLLLVGIAVNIYKAELMPHGVMLLDLSSPVEPAQMVNDRYSFHLKATFFMVFPTF
jgi:hypothetical protein